MAQHKRAVVDKWKKKKVYTILGPKLVGNVELGETIAEKPEKVIGRTLKVNMAIVTNQARKKNIDLTFKVRDVRGSNAITDIVAYEVKNSYLRRLFRRRTSKIETIQYLTSKDGHRFKIKAVIVTLKKVERPKKTDIRKMMEETIANFVKENNVEKIFSVILEKNILEEILPKVKKIAVPKKAEVELVKLIK